MNGKRFVYSFQVFDKFHDGLADAAFCCLGPDLTGWVEAIFRNSGQVYGKNGQGEIGGQEQ